MMKLCGIVLAVLCIATISYAGESTVTLHLVSADGIGKEIGKVTLTDTKYGLLLTPSLSDFPPGIHGFHVHENGSCDPSKKDDKMVAALAAGGHFDPDKSGKHEGPYAEGHLGDLPPLYVDADGKASVPVLAPRLKAENIKGHALMIHAGGDNFSDQPAALGGGGARVACGVVN